MNKINQKKNLLYFRNNWKQKKKKKNEFQLTKKEKKFKQLINFLKTCIIKQKKLKYII